MASDDSVKRKVRDRDQQRCSECGMTAEEHKRRFGRTLHVHRTEGLYTLESCTALCQLCHQAEHSFKCAVRKRDGYVCTQCGMTGEEHHLEVHCDRSDNCDESAWRRLGVKEEECYTLCWFCHLSKHSIKPAVLRRDNFQCQECGKSPGDIRHWGQAVGVHRLEGYCGERAGPSADPAGFVTLCHECHKKKHPDKFTEYIRLGFEMSLPEIIREHADKLGITLPIVGRDQLTAYREYLLVVNFFIDHFRKNGVPEESQLRDALLELPGTSLSSFLRRQAALQATKAFDRSIRILPTRKERQQLKKMSEEERKTYQQAREDRRLDWVMRENASPSVTFRSDKGSLRVKVWDEEATAAESLSAPDASTNGEVRPPSSNEESHERP